jgi:hypothetical protein
LSLQQIFQTLPALYQHLLGIVQFPLDQGDAIATNVKSDKSLGASDGSCLHNTLAAFAVKLSPRDKISQHPNPFALTSVQGVDGAPGHITSLRAESRGGIATILLCLILYKKWPASFSTANQLTIYFDNKAVIKRFKAPPLERNDFLAMDYDLWQEMQHLKRLLPFKIRFKWVKAHQDDTLDPREIEGLPDKVQLNIQVDAMAGEYRSTMPTHVPTIRFTAGDLWIGVNGVYHHHFPAKAIRQHVHGPSLQAYIMTKTGWTEEEFGSIEWETYAIVLKELSDVQQVNWIKLAHDWQNTGHQKMKLKQDEASWSCPLHCGAHETPMHFCQCTADIAIARKTIHLATLRDQLRTAKTCPTLCRAIIEAIAHHCELPNDDPFIPAATPRAQQIQQAIQRQQALGMNHLLKGRVVQDLFAPQEAYCQANHRTNKASPTIRWKAWRKKVIHAFVTFTLSTWNDRNAIYHGTFLDNSRLELIAHIHESVRLEYIRHTTDTESFMDVHFNLSLQETLQRSLSAMRTWLKRVECSRRRQSLLQAAKTKIAQIHHDRHYVDANAILSLSNRNLSKWIHREFLPSSENQTTIERFFRPS